MSISRITAWIIWMIASIFYAYQYLFRVMPNIIINDVMQQFHMDAAMFGQYAGVYYIGYSLMHLPIGIMLDRYGPKKVMPFCILLTVIGSLPLFFAHHWVWPVIGRVLIGIGSSAAILGTFKIIRICFDEKIFARMLSISVTIGLVGAVYGGAPLNSLRETFGYLPVVQVISVVGVFLAITTYFLVPNMENTNKRTIMSDIKGALGNKKVIGICLLAGLMVGPLECFSDAWGTKFLTEVYKLNAITASALPSMVYIGMGLGGPVLSLIAEKTGHYLATVIGSAIVMAILFLGIITGQFPSLLMMPCFLLIGACCSYQILAIYQASTYVPEHAGLITALANMIIMIFGYAFHSATGSVIHLLGGVANKSALIAGVSIIPIALIVAVLGLLALRQKSKA